MIADAGSVIRVVVDLTVEDHHPSSVGRDHWLVAGRRQVDDREAALAERHPHRVIEPDALVVGPTMADCGRHALNAVGEGTNVRGHQPDHTTHD